MSRLDITILQTWIFEANYGYRINHGISDYLNCLKKNFNNTTTAQTMVFHLIQLFSQQQKPDIPTVGSVYLNLVGLSA